MTLEEFQEQNEKYVIKTTTDLYVLDNEAAYFVAKKIDTDQGIVTGDIFNDEFEIMATDRYYFYKGTINLPCTNLSPTQISKLKNIDLPIEQENE